MASPSSSGSFDFSQSTQKQLSLNTLTSALNLSNPTQMLVMKLHPGNYLSWKAQIMPLLRGNNLIRFVDGTSKAPPSVILGATKDSAPVKNPDYTLWYQQDQNLLSLLISSLREDIISLIIDAQSSRELWIMLEKAYASPSAIADQLAAAGRPISTADFNCIVFKGLRHEFHPAIPNLADKGGDASFTDLHINLSNYELLLNNFSTPSQPRIELVMPPLPISPSLTASPSANYTQRTSMRFGNNYGNHNHSSRVTPAPIDTSSRASSNQNRHPALGSHRTGNNNRSYFHGSVQYQICHRYNHTADACRQRYNHANPPILATLASAHTASFYPNNLTDAWYPDTGATYNATPDLQSLDHGSI
ncbi:uncharacterized protein LOC141673361 [Apium graveolens]|uniref:uncharacterized protein LOC141673361 n=1 Tax=Apium graveolens TaxID=4045 RepID=UPI003D793C18